jgi:hypothetical protein
MCSILESVVWSCSAIVDRLCGPVTFGRDAIALTLYGPLLMSRNFRLSHILRKRILSFKEKRSATSLNGDPSKIFDAVEFNLFNACQSSHPHILLLEETADS